MILCPTSRPPPQPAMNKDNDEHRKQQGKSFHGKSLQGESPDQKWKYSVGQVWSLRSKPGMPTASARHCLQ